METSEILVLFLSSSVIGAVVSSLKDIVLAKLNRKAAVEDRKTHQEDRSIKNSNRVEALEAKLDSFIEEFRQYVQDHGEISKGIIRSNKLILQGKIEYLAVKFINDGKITLDHHKMIHEMWHEYHYTWKGNGDLNFLMSKVDELEIIYPEE